MAIASKGMATDDDIALAGFCKPGQLVFCSQLKRPSRFQVEPINPSTGC